MKARPWWRKSLRVSWKLWQKLQTTLQLYVGRWTESFELFRKLSRKSWPTRELKIAKLRQLKPQFVKSAHNRARIRALNRQIKSLLKFWIDYYSHVWKLALLTVCVIQSWQCLRWYKGEFNIINRIGK